MFHRFLHDGRGLAEVVIDSTPDGQTPTREAAQGPEEKAEASHHPRGAQRPTPTTLSALWRFSIVVVDIFAAIHDSLAALQWLSAHLGHPETDIVSGTWTPTRSDGYFFLRGTAVSAAT